jgi:hypothetical protein
MNRFGKALSRVFADGDERALQVSGTTSDMRLSVTFGAVFALAFVLTRNDWFFMRVAFSTHFVSVAARVLLAGFAGLGLGFALVFVPQRNLARLVPFLVFLFPAVYLYEHIIPNQYFTVTTGNDFQILYSNFKIYLLNALNELHFPLWSPSEGAGFPFYSNPFTQAFYPLNLLLFALYRLTGGYSQYDHHLYAVLGLCIFAVGIYLWLRSLGFSTRQSVFTSCVISISYKITELMRFVNALHTAAWFPFILLGITLSLRKPVRGALLIFASFIMMVTAGYPYFIYYSPFLIAPYIILLLVRRIRQGMDPAVDVSIKKWLGGISISIAAALAICAPYLIKISQLLAQTVDRSGHDFEYSTYHVFNFMNTLGSLLYPPSSNPEGWYYFGMIGILLILLFLISRVTGNRNTPRTSNTMPLLYILIWYSIISYITYGKYSYLFKLLWQYVPGFSSLRVWGRMNIILLPILSLLLVQSFAYLEQFLSDSGERSLSRKSPMIDVYVFAMCFLVILAVQIDLFVNHTAVLAFSIPMTTVNVPYIYVGIVSFALVFSTLWLRVSGRFNFARKSTINFVTACLVLWSMFDVGLFGKYQWASTSSPDQTRIAIDLSSTDVKSFSTRRIFVYDTLTLSPSFNAGIIDSWYYKRYNDFIQKHGSAERESFETLMGISTPRKLFMSGEIEYAFIKSYLQDSDAFEGASRAKMDVIKYNGDRLVVQTSCEKEGYLSFIDNWDPDWEVRVNGHRERLERLFGTFKSVVVPAGTNVVEFAYVPKLFSH